MIAVDTSALVAIILGEPEAEQFARTMQSQVAIVCTASVFETSMVTESRQGPDAVHDVGHLLQRLDVQVHAVDEDLAWAAHRAWQRFGKGRHPASLNFGDCFSYALAQSLSVPLLYKGTDFAQTDIAAAI